MSKPHTKSVADPEINGPEDIDWSRVRPVGARGSKSGRLYNLKLLRVAFGKTQADVSRETGMAQGDVSKLEARQDVKLSTLERYVEALGGKVEVAVVVGDRRYRVDLGG